MAHRAVQAVQRADCAMIVVDGIEGLADGDKRVAKAASDMGKAAVWVVNKWDQREPPDGNLGRTSPIKKDFVKMLTAEAPDLSYAPVRFTSALESTGLEGALNAVRSAVDNWGFRASTGQLNRLIQDAVYEKPLSRKGKAFRVYYLTQPETKPPVFVMFCNDPELVHFSYMRYLENVIRRAYPLEGTPIRLVARASLDHTRDPVNQNRYSLMHGTRCHCGDGQVHRGSVDGLAPLDAP
jgi:GTP-binding protein